MLPTSAAGRLIGGHPALNPWLSRDGVLSHDGVMSSWVMWPWRIKTEPAIAASLPLPFDHHLSQSLVSLTTASCRCHLNLLLGMRNSLSYDGDSYNLPSHWNEVYRCWENAPSWIDAAPNLFKKSRQKFWRNIKWKSMAWSMKFTLFISYSLILRLQISVIMSVDVQTAPPD